VAASGATAGAKAVRAVLGAEKKERKMTLTTMNDFEQPDRLHTRTHLTYKSFSQT